MFLKRTIFLELGKGPEVLLFKARFFGKDQFSFFGKSRFVSLGFFSCG